MDLRGQEIKNTYGNVVTIGSSAGSPTTGELTNGQNSSFTSTYLGGNFGIGSSPTTYGSLNVLALGSSGSAAGGIIDIVGTSGRLASIYTEASGKLVLTADPTNGEAGTSMEFNVDGSNAMFIDSSQRVGVNTTSPVSALTVVGTTTAGITVQSSSGASNGLKIFNDSTTDIASIVNHYSGPLVLGTANNERMRIDSTGKVGIGTSSPQSILHISADKTVYTDYGVVFRGGTDNNNTYTGISLVSAGDGLGGIIGSNYLHDGSTASQPNSNRSSAYIRFANTTAAGQTSSINIGGFVKGSTVDVPRLFIDNTGNVGISTSSPAQRFHVNSGTDNIAALFQSTDQSVSILFDDSLKVTEINSNNGQFIFSVNGASGGTTATEAMRIDRDGNLGIGTTSPTYKLDIDAGSDNIGAIIRSSDSVAQIAFRDNTTGGDANVRLGATGTDMTFFTDGDEKMRIDSSGNVGIGTTTPETKLDVDGDIQTAAPETSTNAAWKLGNVGLGGVEVGPIDYITVSVGGFVVKLPIAIFPETQAFYDRVIADGGTFEGLLGYESAVTILKAQ